MNKEHTSPKTVWEGISLPFPIQHDLLCWGSERNIHPKILNILVKRGIHSTHEAEKFLFGELKDTLSPLEFGKQIFIAVDRVEKAFKSKEKIIIFGDYDADGISACSIIMNVFQELQPYYQFDLDFIIPDRFTEGYGLNDQNIDRLIQMNPDLVITVDCGISSSSQIKRLKELGIDVIITDHHEPKEKLPTDAIAIVHPKFCNYPFPYLCGAGVAYQFCKGLWEVKGKKAPAWVSEDLLDLVALGTICDVMELKGDNRIYVKYGLKKIEEKHRLAFDIMSKQKWAKWKNVTSYTVGYQIGPRINAVGRIKNADCLVHMFTSQDPNQIQKILDVMENCNNERKKLQEYIVKEGIKQIENSKYEYTSVIIGDENFHEGVVGTAASQIMEHYYRPTFVLAKTKDGLLKGSARSIEDVNLFEIIQMYEQHLLSWGGHHAAAGLSLHPDEAEKFFSKVDETLSQYSKDKWVKRKIWDEILSASDLTNHFIQSLFSLEPFGQGFSKITWLVNGTIADKKNIGNDLDKIKGNLQLDGICIPYIMWKNGSKVNIHQSYTFYGHLEWNDYSNQIQFTIIDVRG